MLRTTLDAMADGGLHDQLGRWLRAATRPMPSGSCPTSRRCSTTTRSWPGSTCTRGSSPGTRAYRAVAESTLDYARARDARGPTGRSPRARMPTRTASRARPTPGRWTRSWATWGRPRPLFMRRVRRHRRAATGRAARSCAGSRRTRSWPCASDLDASQVAASLAERARLASWRSARRGPSPAATTRSWPPGTASRWPPSRRPRRPSSATTTGPIAARAAGAAPATRLLSADGRLAPLVEGRPGPP